MASRVNRIMIGLFIAIQYYHLLLSHANTSNSLRKPIVPKNSAMRFAFAETHPTHSFICEITIATRIYAFERCNIPHLRRQS